MYLPFFSRTVRQRTAPPRAAISASGMDGYYPAMTGAAEMTPCLCGCGEWVTGRWKRGHARRGEGGYQASARPPGRPAMEPIPGPDVLEDFGLVDVGDAVPDRPEGPLLSEPGPLPPDEPPAHAQRGWRREARTRGKGKAPKVTAAIRGDIEAKISFALEVPGQVWAARDPVCGGTFVQQRPQVASALTEIVCQSADLVAWFSGSGGMFMLWLNLGAACWPVVTVAMAHHVYHSIEAADGSQGAMGPDMARYAA